MDIGVAGYVTAGWKPAPGTPPAAAGFARAIVAQAAPGGRDRAKCLLWAASKLATWATGLGMDAVPEVLLHPSVIERFAAHAPGISGPARRTLRTNLRFLARRVVPHLDPADAPLPRERAKAPYARQEIAGYLTLAGAQPTPARRCRALALVCLGAGAGLIRSDLRQARGTDVVTRSGGLLVQVRGTRPRVVPVLARYHAPLAEAAAFAGEGFLTGGDKPERGNVTNPLTRSLAGGGGLPPLDTSRLRATWLAECAVLIGLPAFMHAAGISCCQRLGDVTAGLTAGSEHDAVALLGALAAGGAVP
jgi:integrase